MHVHTAEYRASNRQEDATGEELHCSRHDVGLWEIQQSYIIAPVKVSLKIYDINITNKRQTSSRCAVMDNGWTSEFAKQQTNYGLI